MIWIHVMRVYGVLHRLKIGIVFVFAAFMISGVTSIKMMGFGVSFAVLLDATLIRALLVPALMRLFGESNWWAPKALRRFTITH